MSPKDRRSPMPTSMLEAPLLDIDAVALALGITRRRADQER